MENSFSKKTIFFYNFHDMSRNVKFKIKKEKHEFKSIIYRFPI